jgi:lipopolysaccharide transport system permease protein
MAVRKAGLSLHEVKIVVNGRVARARFEARNRSPEEWRAADGFAFGYHLFDADTDTLLVEGPRFSPAKDAPPGAAVPVEIECELPEEPGPYRILISAMREGVCWYYERGWPFLRIEAEVAGGRARILRGGVATRRDLALERWRRTLARALSLPLLTAWRHRSLIRTMVRRDILGRYRGSFGGAFWTIWHPLLLMLTYFFVFGIVLQARFGGDPSRTTFALYFLAGMLPWLAFSEAAGRAPGVLLEHRNFVKKLVFPVEILPVNLVAAGLVSELFGLGLFSAAFWLARGSLPASVIWLPALLIPQVLFTAGICWFLAAMGVFVRDLGQVIGFVLTLWFFLTPICYPEASLPPGALEVLSANPLYVLVNGYRAVFLESQAPPLAPLLKLWVLASAVCIAGHAGFYKLRRSFADVI